MNEGVGFTTHHPVPLQVNVSSHLGLPIGFGHLSPHILTAGNSAVHPGPGPGSSPLVKPERGKGKSPGLSARMPTFLSSCASNLLCDPSLVTPTSGSLSLQGLPSLGPRNLSPVLATWKTQSRSVDGDQRWMATFFPCSRGPSANPGGFQSWKSTRRSPHAAARTLGRWHAQMSLPLTLSPSLCLHLCSSLLLCPMPHFTDWQRPESLPLSLCPHCGSLCANVMPRY